MERNIATLLGTIVGVALPLIVGIVVSIVLTKRRDDFKVTAWPTIIGIILTFASCSAALTRSKQSKEIIVDRKVVGRAQAFAYSIDRAALAQYSQETKESVARALKAQGEQVDAGRITAVSIQPSFHGIPLGAVKTEVSVPDKLFMYEFVGPSGADMVSLTCLSPSAERFEVDLNSPTDKCGQAVKQTFDIARGELLPPVKAVPVLQPLKRLRGPQ